MEQSYVVNITKYTRENTAHLVVLSTNQGQVTVMHLHPEQEIGAETHEGLDQYTFIVSGKGTAVLDGAREPIGPGDMVSVHSGTRHNIIANKGVSLHLYTVYSSPDHPADECVP